MHGSKVAGSFVRLTLAFVLAIGLVPTVGASDARAEQGQQVEVTEQNQQAEGTEEVMRLPQVGGEAGAQPLSNSEYVVIRDEDGVKYEATVYEDNTLAIQKIESVEGDPVFVPAEFEVTTSRGTRTCRVTDVSLVFHHYYTVVDLREAKYLESVLVVPSFLQLPVPRAYIIGDAPALEDVTIWMDKALVGFEGEQPSLTDLDVRYSLETEGIECENIAEAYPNIESYALDVRPYDSSQSGTVDLSGCENLRYVHFAAAGDWTVEGLLEAPSLESIDFEGGITDIDGLEEWVHKFDSDLSCTPNVSYCMLDDSPSAYGGVLEYIAENYGEGYAYPQLSNMKMLENGSIVSSEEQADGSTVERAGSVYNSASSVVTKDAEGNVTSVEATVPADDETAAAGATVALPMSPLTPASSAKEAPLLLLKAPAGTKVSIPVVGEDAGADEDAASSAASSVALLLVTSDGSETILPKTAVRGEAVSVEVPGDCVLKLVDIPASFPDVKDGVWYEDSGVVDFVFSRGILAGVGVPGGPVEFQGDEPTNRGMFVTMLHRLEMEAASSGERFGDVPEDSWYAGSSTWAAEKEIAAGYENAEGAIVFDGEGAVTREQMAVFLYRYAQWLGVDVSDRALLPEGEAVSDYAEEAMSWALAVGLIQGDGEGALRAYDGATRAEAAAVVMRFVNAFN